MAKGKTEARLKGKEKHNSQLPTPARDSGSNKHAVRVQREAEILTV